MNKWSLKEQAPEEFGKEFPEFSALTRNLLWQRGIKTQKDIDEFFNPDYSTDLHDPLLLKDAQKAIDRILAARENNEKVMVYGDYDADGVCGATIIYSTLINIGFDKNKLGVYLPDREKEGYGLNTGAVEEFIKGKYNLIITIDCGTTSHEAINFANKNNIDTIVLDHHRVIDKPPDCYAFVNPHQEDDEYPFKDLCGAAVAFKIACALAGLTSSKCLTSDVKPARVKPARSHEKWLLDLVALATITDVMPVLGENRTLVKYGLFVLAQAKRVGFKALMDVSGVRPRFSPDSLSTNINAFTLGFILGPRINAAGRMDHANTAFALLNSVTYKEAVDYANQINEKNKERQELVARIMGEVEERISGSVIASEAKQSRLPRSPSTSSGSLAMTDGEEHLVIFEGDKSWPIGVAGLVAGRMAEKYYRPSFIYQIKEDGPPGGETGTATGSVRAIPGFHVVRALESVRDLLVNFGGHPQAGGFTCPIDKLDEMKGRIEKFAKENLTEEDFAKKVEYSAELKHEDISWQMYDEVERFEPFGEANREPIFLLRDSIISGFDILGAEGKHLRLMLNILGNKKKAMAFGMGIRAEELNIGDSIDILFNFSIDEWNGNRELMIRVVDFRKV